MSTFNKTVAAQDTWNCPAGSSFQLLEASSKVTIEFVKSGQVINRANNVEAGYYYRPNKPAGTVEEVFDQVRVKAGMQETFVKVDISGEWAGMAHIAGNLVQADGNLQLTRDGKAFTATILTGGFPNEGYKYTEFWNPANSGKNIIITSMSAYQSTSAAMTSLYLARTTEILHLADAWTTVSEFTAAHFGLTPGKQSVALSYSGNNVDAYASIWLYYAQVNGMERTKVLDAPMLIAPGSGIVFRTDELNDRAVAGLTWVEEQI